MLVSALSPKVIEPPIAGRVFAVRRSTSAAEGVTIAAQINAKNDDTAHTNGAPSRVMLHHPTTPAIAAADHLDGPAIYCIRGLRIG